MASLWGGESIFQRLGMAILVDGKHFLLANSFSGVPIGAKSENILLEKCLNSKQM